MYLLSQSFSIKANKKESIQDTNYRQTNITLQNVQSLGQMKKTPQLILFNYSIIGLSFYQSSCCQFFQLFQREC